MELWDAYDRDGNPAGKDLVRGEPIPEGLYHIVCEVLVRHKDGDHLLMRRDLSKPVYPGYYEMTAGGSALKGEDRLTCAKRELREETGIASGCFTEMGRFVNDDSRRSIFYSFLCETDWDKDAVTLQEGETIDYRWVGPEEFTAFLHSDEVIENQRERWKGYLRENGYLE